MNERDERAFSTTLMGIGELYGREVSPSLAGIYFESLKQFDIQAIQAAITAHINNPDNGQFFPKPADIVKMIGGSNGDKAMQAWSKVDKAVRQVGTYASVAFDDPIIHRVLQDMGGWVMLGTKKDDEWPFVAREFETRYKGYAMRGEVPDHPRLLYGIAQIHNEPNGHAVEPPRLIGNQEAAKRLMLGSAETKKIGVKNEAGK